MTRPFDLAWDGVSGLGEINDAIAQLSTLILVGHSKKTRNIKRYSFSRNTFRLYRQVLYAAFQVLSWIRKSPAPFDGLEVELNAERWKW